MSSANLLEILLITYIIVTLLFSQIAILLPFDSKYSDFKKQIFTIENKLSWFPYLSKMHEFSGQKTRMKDVQIYFVTIINFFLKTANPKKIYIFTLCFYHFFSSLLIYKVSSFHWGVEVGAICSIVHFFSFWPYVVIQLFGLQILAELLFLIIIYYFQHLSLSGISFLENSLIGILIVLLNFSSASARKYNILILFGYFYYILNLKLSFNFFLNFSISVTFSYILFFFTSNFFEKKTINYLNTKNSHTILIIKFYLQQLYNFLFIFLLFLFNIIFPSFENLYSDFLVSILFSLLLFFFFNFPNTIKNFYEYGRYYTLAQSNDSQDKFYDKYFKKKFGKIYRIGNEGITWYFKFFLRYCIFEIILILICFFLILINNKLNLEFILFGLIVLSPFIYTHITKGVKSALSLYCGYISIIFLLGFCINKSLIVSEVIKESFVIFIIAVYVIYNFFVLVYKILIPRFAIYYLKKFILKNKNLNFYFLKNKFTETIFSQLIDELKTLNIRVKLVDKIQQIKNGYLILPPINKKNLYYQGTKIATSEENLFLQVTGVKNIQELKNLYKKNFFQLAFFGDNTYSTQAYPIPSYQDLVLNDVNSEDFFYNKIIISKIYKNT